MIEEKHPTYQSASAESGGPNETSDIELLAQLRAGDNAAFAELYRRHVGAVRRSALRLMRDSADVDDLVAEAFFRVLQAVRRGNGPQEHVRTYLQTVAKRISWEWSARRRDVPVDDEELDLRVEPHGDGVTRGLERRLISRAFSSLPERWRTVLWHVEVEGERAAVVAPRLGLRPNATAALARRARDGLRAAYLQAHLNESRSLAGCRSVVTKLGAYTAGNLQGAEASRIRAHIRGCASCEGLHEELQKVSSALRAYAGLLPLPVSGVALASHPAAAGTAVKTGFVAAGKGLYLGMRIKLALGAASVAAVGVVVVAIGPFGGPGLALYPPSVDGGVHSVGPTAVAQAVLDLAAVRTTESARAEGNAGSSSPVTSAAAAHPPQDDQARPKRRGGVTVGATLEPLNPGRGLGLTADSGLGLVVSAPQPGKVLDRPPVGHEGQGGPPLLAPPALPSSAHVGDVLHIPSLVPRGK